MSTSGTSWTEEEDARLRELAETGLTSREIGEHLGRTGRSVIGRAYRIKVELLAGSKSRDHVRTVSHKGRLIKKLVKRRSTDKPEQVRSAIVTFTPYSPVKTKVVSPNPRRTDELPPGSCKYPVGRDPAGEWLLCARPRRQRAYCDEHHRECHQIISRPYRKRA